MKSDHRHELKTNELAEWLNNLPRWAKENSITIICISALIIGITTFYVWRIYNKRAVAQKQIEFTNLIGQLFNSRMQILRARAQDRDLSFMLLQPADNLRVFAQNTDDDLMAAFALIKRAEALRMELHYRQGAVSEREAAAQIDQAKTSYAEALERCSRNPSLTAMAQFGLGLCEEELGSFEAAEQIYRDITTNPDLESTVAAAQAELRLKLMDGYKDNIILKPAPKKPVVEMAVRTSDMNVPADRLPVEANLPAEVNTPVDFDTESAAPDFINDLNNLDDVILIEE